MGKETIDIPVLTCEEQIRAANALNRVKRKSIETNKVQFVLIAFEKGEMIFSESHRMERVMS